jgi:hypothetical protein
MTLLLLVTYGSVALSSQGVSAAPSQINALSDPDAQVREYAAKELGIIGDPGSVPPLIGALKDSDPLVRQSAALALGEIKDRRATVPLIATLKDLDPLVRRNAALALGEIGDPRAAVPLSNALKDADPRVREFAADAITLLAKVSKPAVAPLIDALVIRDAERHLIALGYKPLSADGVMGARAIAAIKDFQKDRGLPITGKLDRNTIDALGVKVIAGATIEPSSLFDPNVKLVKGTEVHAKGLLEYGGNSATLTVANGEFDILLDARGDEMGKTMDGKPVQVRGTLTGEYFTILIASTSDLFSGSISRKAGRIPQIRVIDFEPAKR